MLESDIEQHDISIVQGEFGRVTVNASSRPLTEHAHEQVNLVFWLSGGRSRMRSGKTIHSLDTNKMVLFNAWQPHAKLSENGEPAELMAFLVETEWLSTVLGIAPPFHSLFWTSCGNIPEEALAGLHNVAAVVKDGSNVRPAEIEDELAAVMRIVYTAYAREHVSLRQMSQARPHDFRIRKAVRYIDEIVGANPRLKDVADHVGLSRSHFFEQFRRCVGASPHSYIDWARLKIATDWLGDDERSLADLSDHLGFSAPSHFCRFFIRHLGVAPSQYRRRMYSLKQGPRARPPLADVRTVMKRR